MRVKAPQANEAFDRLPIHLQQALLITATILGRINHSSLDKATKCGQLRAVQTPANQETNHNEN